jgi:hypothetical protein
MRDEGNANLEKQLSKHNPLNTTFRMSFLTLTRNSSMISEATFRDLTDQNENWCYATILNGFKLWHVDTNQYQASICPLLNYQ